MSTKESSTPFMAIGNEEINELPPLRDTIQCWKCGGIHDVHFGKEKVMGEWVDSKKLGYFHCGDKTYLCGLGGKELRPKKGV